MTSACGVETPDESTASADSPLTGCMALPNLTGGPTQLCGQWASTWRYFATSGNPQTYQPSLHESIGLRLFGYPLENPNFRDSDSRMAFERVDMNLSPTAPCPYGACLSLKGSEELSALGRAPQGIAPQDIANVDCYDTRVIARPIACLDRYERDGWLALGLVTKKVASNAADKDGFRLQYYGYVLTAPAPCPWWDQNDVAPRTCVYTERAKLGYFPSNTDDYKWQGEALGLKAKKDRDAKKSNFVTVQGNHLFLNGQRFRHLAANVNGLAFETLQQATVDLNGLAQHNVREVRILIANDSLGTSAILDRLQHVIDIAKPLGIRIAVVLTGNYGGRLDLWTPAGDPEVNAPYKKGRSFPSGDAVYLINDPNVTSTDGNPPPQLFSDAWLTQGYKVNFLPFAKAVVSRFRDEPTIMSWEVAGEMKSPTFNIQNVISFYRAVAREIKLIDPNHVVTPGLISTRQVGMSNLNDQDVLFGDGLFDFISVHSYEEDNESKGEDDAALAQRLWMPYVISEFGFTAPSYHQKVHNYLQKVFNQGAESAGFWGIEYGMPHGLGDSTYTEGRMPDIESLWAEWASWQ
ncbi:hypothetical protein A7982_12813 [Minicystis rosea]|nr:hypothetical protein A7982_12813 [Minicystis rosea]